ncbi:MAG: flagellar assembly protein FliW [Desulfovibrionaceae bacterium]|nr:flagellar assembly protein FliW [Desulfovibrionaceae bacterium]
MARRTEITEVQTRLGPRRIDPDKIIAFPRGLMGFEDQREFTLLQLREDAPFLVLQSLSDPNLGLLVGDPYAFLPEYRIKIGDAEQNLLRVKSAAELAVLVTVSIPPGHPERTALNLTGPILINHEARIGLQAPQSDINPPRVLLRLCTSREAEDKAEGGARPGDRASSAQDHEAGQA